MQPKTLNLNLGTIQIDNVTQKTISIIGGKGSGKTQTLKMMANSIPEDVPCFIFDPLDNIRIEGYQRVVITRALAKQADKNKKDDDVGDDLGGKYAQVFNRVKDKKIIFSFRDMLQEEIVFFCNSFFRYWKPENCLIFIDEMHEFTPERGMSMEYSEEMERAVRHWRNKNVGFIFNTQRPSFTSKKVLGLTDYLILYRVTWTADKETVKYLIKDILTEQETDNIMSTMQTKGFLEGFTINFQPT